MAVLNTTSPTDRPGAPREMPSSTVPSSSARIAVSVTGFAYVGLQKTTDSVRDRPEARGIRRAGMIPARRRSRHSSRDTSGTGKREISGSKQVAKALDARRSPVTRPRVVHGAAGEDVSVHRPVDELDALAAGRELDQVLADDVAGPQARVARLRAGLFRRCSERERRAGRRIEL